MSVHIVIPVRDNMEFTVSICEQLKDELFDICHVFDNGSVDGTAAYLGILSEEDNRYHSHEAAGLGIYDMWTAGFEKAREAGAEAVLFLNNDIEIWPGTVQYLRGALQPEHVGITYPDYTRTLADTIWLGTPRQTTGTYRHGGMSGYCFMVKVSKVNWSPLVDPQFVWWGGDDDIAFNMQKAGGRQVRVTGLPINHYLEGTARHHDLGEQKGRDLSAVIKKWGR